MSEAPYRHRDLMVIPDPAQFKINSDEPDAVVVTVYDGNGVEVGRIVLHDAGARGLADCLAPLRTGAAARLHTRN